MTDPRLTEEILEELKAFATPYESPGVRVGGRHLLDAVLALIDERETTLKANVVAQGWIAELNPELSRVKAQLAAAQGVVETAREAKRSFTRKTADALGESLAAHDAAMKATGAEG